MTTKELSLFFGKTRQTILNKAKELNYIIENGKEKIWSKEEVEGIANKLYKTLPLSIKESIDFTFNKLTGKPIDNLKGERVDRLESIVEKLIIQQSETNQILLKFISNQPKQIENKVNKISVKDYLKNNNITSFNFNGLCIQAGKQAARLSKELHREIAFTNDGQFDVGLYDEDLMQTAVLIAKRLLEKDNNLFGG
jgi:hypothetical protein